MLRSIGIVNSCSGESETGDQITIVSDTGSKLAGNDGNEVDKVVKCNKHWICPNSFSLESIRVLILK